MDIRAHNEQRPIVAAVDLQFHDKDLIVQSLALAAQRQCPLLLLHVVHEAADSPGFYRRHNDGNVATPLVDIAHTLLSESLEQVVGDHAGDPPVQVHRRVVEGIPANRIAEVAEQVDAQAVVLFSHGRDTLGRFWHGSVTEGVRKRCTRELVVLTEKAAAVTDPVTEDTPPGAVFHH
jgi:nucleotide-binding universal stress UspA family protein